MPTHLSLIKSIPNLVTHSPRTVFILVLIFLIPIVSQLNKLRSLDNVDDIQLKDHPDAAFYETIKETFGNDEFFVIAFSHPDLFSKPVLRTIENITMQLENFPEVRKIQSLANADYIFGAKDYFEVRPFLEEIPDDPEKLQLLKQQALENDLYRGNLINARGDTTAIVVFPRDHDSEKDGSFRKRLLDKTQNVLKHENGIIEVFHLAGWTVTNLTLSQYMQNDVAVFIPLTYIFITATVWIVFRNIRMMILALIHISACTAATMAFFPLIGITLNTVTTIIPPLIMALALSDAVHIFSHMERKLLDSHQNQESALKHILNKIIGPSFICSLTTAVGFISLAVSEIGPIRDFAYASSAGMAFKFILSFTMIPSLILFCNPKKIYCLHNNRRYIESFTINISNFVQKYPGSISIATFVLVSLALWFSTSINIETNLLKNFKKSSSIQQDLDFVTSRLSGVATLDISLKATDKDAFRDPSKLKILDNLQEYAKKIQGVDRTISFLDFLKDMNMSFHDENREYYCIPESKNLISQYLLLYDVDDLKDFITTDYDHARILIRLSEHGSSGQARIISELHSFIDSHDQNGLNVRISGRAVQDVNTIDALVWGQVNSLALAAAVISVIMFFALRSLLVGGISLIPNAFPIILNFGIIGALHIPLNTATALISVVAIGIAVDDTIHFLTEYSRNRNENLTLSQALHKTTIDKGLAITATSLILMLGFGVLLCSNFVPTISFGGLSALIMLTAWIGDLIVLPALMLTWHNKFQKLKTD